jgi:hypothetical protein
MLSPDSFRFILCLYISQTSNTLVLSYYNIDSASVAIAS